MINANKEHLASFFQNQTQYVIPFYQRAYVWEEENWETLWEGISQVYRDYCNHIQNQQDDSIEDDEHFIGTLITKQQEAKRISQVSHELIDGQQRLTTISILLKSLADTCKGELPALPMNINQLLVFKDAHDKPYVRITHNRYDQRYFNAIMLGEDLGDLGKEHKLLRAYNYFKERVAPLTDEERNTFKDIILQRVSVISMLLSRHDDEQVIFDTINSLGVKLTTAELLKNHVFQDDSLKPLFETLWQQIYEDTDDQIVFWNAGKTAGRITRTNIEVLLYCYLIINTLKEVKLERLFNEYKNWLKQKTQEQKKAFLAELKSYAEIYINFPSGEDLNEISFSESEKRFFHLIDGLAITTAYPLILFLYREVADVDERERVLNLIESYLVRRNICQLTTKNYNNLFITIIQKLLKLQEEGHKISAASLMTVLTSFTEDLNRFPNDTEFKLSFGICHLSNQNAKEILFCISLFGRHDPLHDVTKLSSATFSVEHMMPVKWEENWNDSNMDEVQKLKRNLSLRTLGNLTLVNKRLNSKMSNAAWMEKKELLRKFSSLKITTDYLNTETWNEEAIAKRANDLGESALKVWCS